MTVRFKLNAQDLEKILTGKTVNKMGFGGEDVQFFLEDIGITEVAKISAKAVEEVTAKLYAEYK